MSVIPVNPTSLKPLMRRSTHEHQPEEEAVNFNKVMFSSAHDNWSTPKDTYQALDKEFHFNDDPCPLGGVLGLEREWGSSTFVNPPYSEIKKWVAYGYEQSREGKTVVMLIPSRTDTKWWHEYVMKAKEIRFIKGRLKFGGAKNCAPFPSAVVVFQESGGKRKP